MKLAPSICHIKINILTSNYRWNYVTNNANINDHSHNNHFTMRCSTLWTLRGSLKALLQVFSELSNLPMKYSDIGCFLPVLNWKFKFRLQTSFPKCSTTEHLIFTRALFANAYFKVSVTSVMVMEDRSLPYTNKTSSVCRGTTNDASESFLLSGWQRSLH